MLCNKAGGQIESRQSKVRNTPQVVSIDSYHRDYDSYKELLIPYANIQLFIYILLFKLTSVYYSDNNL